ncbi:MAG: AAA family ATPase [Candidatus Gracilibacteria bacterium]|jgi:cell division protease FtsH
MERPGSINLAAAAIALLGSTYLVSDSEPRVAEAERKPSISASANYPKPPDHVGQPEAERPKTENPSLEKPQNLSLEEIARGINCSTSTTYTAKSGDSEPITDNQLFEIIKCNKVKKVEFGTQEGSNEIKIKIYLENGEEITQKIIISFGNDLHRYLLKAGINVRNVNSLFTRKDLESLIPIFLGILMVITIRDLLPRKSKKRDKIPTHLLPQTKFSDIAGLGNVKRELVKLVEELKDRNAITEMGGKIPRGILFVGPPGSGKTLAARAIATESGIPFIAIAGSELESKWMGNTSKAIRDLFENAKELAKKDGACIIFIDELDSLGSKRLHTEDGSASETEHNAIVNQLLTAMDGFNDSDGITVIGATNHPEVLDKALTRAGRFDREITFTYPDQAGRLQLFRILTKNISLADDVRLETLASTLVERSCADVEKVVEEAKLLALKRGAPIVLTQKDLTTALDIALMGMESDICLTPVEQRITAIHEAGHAAIAMLSGGVEVERVTTIPRGRSLGTTLTPPLEERHVLTSKELEWQIKLLLAGTIAEEMETGERSTGATDDLRKATSLATRMVMDYGMMPENGDGRSRFRTHTEAEGIMDLDCYIDQILDRCGEETKKELTANRQLLKAIAERLIQNRSIEHAELLEIQQQYPSGQTL